MDLFILNRMSSCSTNDGKIKRDCDKIVCLWDILAFAGEPYWFLCFENGWDLPTAVLASVCVAPQRRTEPVVRGGGDLKPPKQPPDVPKGLQAATCGLTHFSRHLPAPRTCTHTCTHTQAPRTCTHTHLQSAKLSRGHPTCWHPAPMHALRQ